MKFFVTSTIIGCLAAALIFFGLPILKQESPETFSKVKDTAVDLGQAVKVENIQKTAEAIQEKAAETVETGKKNLEALADNPPTLEGIKEVITENPLKTPESRIVQNTEGAATTEPLPEGTLSTQDAPVPEVPTPDTDPYATWNKDPGYEWGLVVTNSYVYDANMKRLGMMRGGTVISRKSNSLKMNGYVSECYYVKDNNWIYEPMFFYDSDLVLFGGVTYSDANPEQRNLMIEFCKLYGQLEEAKKEAKKKLLQQNPHLHAYKAVRDEYLAFVKKAHAAKAELDSDSPTSNRSQLINDLRQYKADQAQITKRFTDIQSQFNAWNAENVGDTKGFPARAMTPSIQNMEYKLNQMRPAAQEIVPGI